MSTETALLRVSLSAVRRRRFVVAAVLSMSFAAATASAIPIQYSGNSHFYEYFPTNLTWTAARAAAEGLTYDPDGAGPLTAVDGYLVTVTTSGENAFLLANFPHLFWMGATDLTTEGTWMWETGPEAGSTFWVGGPSGTSFGYANWNTGEPNNQSNEDYLIFLSPSGRWNDEHIGPDSAIGYVVEYDAPASVPEPASLLLFGSGLVALAWWRRYQSKRRLVP